MGTAAPRAKTRTGRAKVAPARVRAAVGPEGESHQGIVEAIFVDVPEAPVVHGGVPDLVRRNRRERAKRRLVDALNARGPYPVPEARRAELRMIARRWGQKGFVDAFVEADELEIRSAEERAVLDADARGDEGERFAAAERAYRREVERKYGRIEIRGLQLSERVYQDLEIAYVPLHVEDRSEATVPPPTAKKKKKKTKNGAANVDAMMAMVHALDRPRVPATRALAKHPRLLLIGGPGSGKSTLLAYLATLAAQGKLAAEVGWEADPVPFVVPVRSLREAPVTVAALASAAGAETWFLKDALARGQALLFIDGLDEAKPEVATQTLSAIDAYPSTRVLVTTRPVGRAGEEEPGLPGFASVRLVSMTVPEVHTFIERWCLAAELSLGKARAHAEADASAAADDLKRRVRLRGAIERLAQTPLLCSVLCVVHRSLGESILERRIALYEAMTNVLLYEWDRAKFPEGAAIAQLDALAKRALLARVACWMHKERVAELPEADLIRRFAEHRPALGRLKADAAMIVAEIRDRSGVLVERTPGSFAFSHLTFQEFLAAQEMVKEQEYDALLASYRDKWWHEVIVLAAGFQGADAARLVRGLLGKDGEKVAEGTMLAAQCVETAVDLSASLRGEVEQRVAKLVPPQTREDYERLEKIGDVAGPVLLRGLAKADTEGKASILFALGRLKYEPAMGTMLRFLKDPSTTTKPFTGSYGVVYPAGYLIAQGAVFAALQIAATDNYALSSLLSATSQAHPGVLDVIKIIATHGGGSWGEAAKLVLQRYHATHPRVSSSPAPAPRRSARTG